MYLEIGSVARNILIVANVVVRFYLLTLTFIRVITKEIAAHANY